MPDDVARSFLEWLVAEQQDRENGYRAYREYYEGAHDAQLTERQRRFLQIKMGEEFRANYCPIVVDALAERLKVVGFSAEDQGELLWEWWQANRMDATQGIMHTATVRDGDAYLMVDWDETHQRPRFTFEAALCDGDGMKVVYADERNVPMLASKRWRVKNGQGAGMVRRLNLYYPDRIEKYISNQSEFEGAWARYDHEVGESWPLPWVDSKGQPLGVPVIHFRNKDQGYNYGLSELADVVPLQNALNKSIIDLLAAADTTAFRIFWMVGDDPSGLSISPGSWVYTPRPPSGENGAAVGFFPGEDLSPLISLKDSVAIEIARVTRTPVSYFQISGQRAAEGTLKQEESGLVGKAKDRQVTFGNAWEDALLLARRVWNTFGPGPALDETQIIEAMWADAETRNEKEHLESLKIKAELGVPEEQLWRESGYDDAAIREMKAMKRASERRQANLGSELLRAFDRNVPAEEDASADEDEEDQAAE